MEKVITKERLRIPLGVATIDLVYGDGLGLDVKLGQSYANVKVSLRLRKQELDVNVTWGKKE